MITPAPAQPHGHWPGPRERVTPREYHEARAGKFTDDRGVDHALYSSHGTVQGIYSILLKIPENRVYLANYCPILGRILGVQWNIFEVFLKYFNVIRAGINTSYSIFDSGPPLAVYR